MKNKKKLKKEEKKEKIKEITKKGKYLMIKWMYKVKIAQERLIKWIIGEKLWNQRFCLSYKIIRNTY